MDWTCQCTCDMIPDQFDYTNIIANNKYILPHANTPKSSNKTVMTSNIHTDAINTKNCNLPFLHETRTVVDSSSPSDSNLPSYDPFNPRMIGPRYCEYCHAQSTLNCNPNVCDRPTLYFKRQPPPFRNGWHDENNMNSMNGYDSSSHSGEMDKVMTMDNYGRRAYWAQNSKQGQWGSSHSFKQKQQQLVFQSRRHSSATTSMLNSSHNGNASLSHLLDNNGDESSIGQKAVQDKDGQFVEEQESMSTNKEGAVVISQDGNKTISSPGKLNLFSMFCSSV